MKANELRIGNYLQDQNGNFLLVIHISTESIQTTVLDRSKYPLPNGWQMQPIPLTPDILEKCGFVKQNNGWNKNKKSPYDENCFGLFDHNYCSGELDLKYNVGNGPIPSILYLHQLQNLYFALTGEELEVKL